MPRARVSESSERVEDRSERVLRARRLAASKYAARYAAPRPVPAIPSHARRAPGLRGLRPAGAPSAPRGSTASCADVENAEAAVLVRDAEMILGRRQGGFDEQRRREPRIGAFDRSRRTWLPRLAAADTCRVFPMCPQRVARRPAARRSPRAGSPGRTKRRASDAAVTGRATTQREAPSRARPSESMSHVILAALVFGAQPRAAPHEIQDQTKPRDCQQDDVHCAPIVASFLSTR